MRKLVRMLVSDFFFLSFFFERQLFDSDSLPFFYLLDMYMQFTDS